MAKYKGFSVAEVNDPRGRRNIKSRTTTTPPAHVAGDVYLIPTGATGVWSTHVGEIAGSDGTAWIYQASPPDGLQLYVEDEDFNLEVRDGILLRLVDARTMGVGITRGVNPYFESYTSNVWLLAQDYPFDGTNKLGVPVGARALAWVDSDATMSVRIYDVTNSQTIVEKTGIVASSKGIVNLGTLTNLPAEEALLEFQMKKTAGVASKAIRLSYVGFVF